MGMIVLLAVDINWAIKVGPGGERAQATECRAGDEMLKRVAKHMFPAIDTNVQPRH